MNRVVHFEIPADDVERAKGFYEKVFGWKIEKWEGPMDYWMVMTGEGAPGINGGMAKGEGPVRSVVNTIDVASVDQAIADIQANGGEIVMPKMEVPGVGWMAYFKDTEGNMFGVMQSVPGAM
jgi:hypothetical protein